MKYFAKGVLLVGGMAGFFYGIKKLIPFLMKVQLVYLLIGLGLLFVVIFAGIMWISDQDDFELSTFVWHDSNRVLHEINDKLKDK